MKIDIFNTDKKYQIIYADPPWKYHNYGYKEAVRGSEKEYGSMSTDQLIALPVANLLDNTAILFLWSTSPCLIYAVKLIKAWGFEYKTKAFCWIKMNKNSAGLFWGMGNWTRSNSEDCLLAVKGNPKAQAHDIHQILMTPVSQHSRKPDELVRDNIIKLCGDLPRIELFARRQVEGWDCWGNEC